MVTAHGVGRVGDEKLVDVVAGRNVVGLGQREQVARVRQAVAEDDELWLPGVGPGEARCGEKKAEQAGEERSSRYAGGLAA